MLKRIRYYNFLENIIDVQKMETINLRLINKRLNNKSNQNKEYLTLGALKQTIIISVKIQFA
jgi:hypothetical protein